MKKNSTSTECSLLHNCSSYSKFFNNKWLMLLLLVIVAAGCKKITEETGLTSVCPTVLSTLPANNDTAVSLNATVNATFNKPMDPSSINTLTFTLANGTIPIAGIITYAGSTATFSPTKSLSPSTTYTGTITTGAKDPAHNAMVSNYVWTFKTGAGPDLIPPTVVSTDPAPAAIGVAFNKKISATFSKVMDSLSTTNSFKLYNTTNGGTAVSGTVTYSGATAVFTPTVNLLQNTTYTGTITTTAKDRSGNFLVSNYVWSFTTLAIIAPTVVSTDPSNTATGVLLTKIVSATFSKAMDSLSATTSFTLANTSLGGASVSGSVTYSGLTAVFTPTANLLPNTTYTGTITTVAKDVAGDTLVSNYVWSFITWQSITNALSLGSASNFGAFGGNAGVTNQGLHTMINNGGIATTAASSLVTGFHDGLTGDVYTETPLNVGNATGGIYTAPPAPGTSTSFTAAQTALSDATTAYNSMSPASKPGGIDPGAGELGGLTLAPGVYKAASGTFKITNFDLVLDAKGDPNAVWVFQTAAGLTVGTPTGARSITMINSGQPKNVFWYVGSQAVINYAGGGTMVGTIIAYSGVTLSSPGNSTTTTATTVLNGRALSLVASVTMVNTIINVQ